MIFPILMVDTIVGIFMTIVVFIIYYMSFNQGLGLDFPALPWIQVANCLV